MEGTILICTILISVINAEVIQLTNTNIKTVLEENELVLIDFYANWCYFSNLLDPIFTEASNKLETEFKVKGKVMLAKVDCEQEIDIAKQYTIQKFPTLKLFRYGNICKREYRGARNSDAIVEYIKHEMDDPIKEFGENGHLVKEIGKTYLIGHFHSKSSQNYEMFKKIGFQLRDECNLYFEIIPDISVEKLTFESLATLPILLTTFDDPDNTKRWMQKMCTPLVRNITFQNAEDITEEGLPLVLLFYNSNDAIVTSIYTKFVTDYMDKERESVNFLYADGKTFAHPLSHLGKSESDLPLIVIDSFKHMFVLPATVEDALKDPKILKTFIADLHSGKLHREFHQEPDPAQESLEHKHLDTDEQSLGDKESHIDDTNPVPSVFQKLRPNSNRYTLFHDEF